MSRCFRRGLLACACAIGCVPDFDALRENRGIGGAGGTEPSAGSGGTSGAGNGGAAGTSDTAGVGGAAPGGSGGTESGECGLDAPGVAQFEFDTGLTGRIAGVWAPYPQGDPGLGDSTVDWSATEGHTCLGALRLDIPFAAWADRVSTTLNFQANWE
ncbi:MAG TPA: hypothetical protein VMG12_01695, partial [Polyangiaceae bacterium]|nr:hypothetical protein [Polyangiaceae bacterium]